MVYSNNPSAGIQECAYFKRNENLSQAEEQSVLRFRIIVNDDLPTGLLEETSLIRIKDLRGFLEDGQEVSLGAEEFSFTVSEPNSVAEPSWADGISIAPIPATDYLQLDLAGLEYEKLEIISLTGRVLPIRLENNQLVIHSLPVGTYFLRLSSEGASILRRFIKQ